MSQRNILPRFFSSRKRPSLIPLLGLTVILAVVIVCLLAVGGERNTAAVCLAVAVYALGAGLILLQAFIRQIAYDPYSYNTIFFAGFGLFALSVAVTHLALAVRMFRQPEIYQGTMVISTLLGSAQTFMILSAPFILMLSIGLLVSNISLIRHERKRLVNLLGIILSFVMLAVWVFIYVFDYWVTGSQMEVMMHDLVTNLVAAVYLYFECMIIGTIIADIIAARYKPLKDKDYIIILGCGIQKDGKPTPLLRSRIDRALAFAKEQEELTGRKVTFVTSGGQGPDEVISESASMKTYLLEQGIPEERIIEEDRSVNTLQNMRFSRDLIKGHAQSEDVNIAFSTNNYHVFRSGYYSSSAGMRAVGMGAKTKWYFWPNSAVREFVGLLAKLKGRQILILGGMIAFYVALTLIEYLAF